MISWKDVNYVYRSTLRAFSPSLAARGPRLIHGVQVRLLVPGMHSINCIAFAHIHVLALVHCTPVDQCTGAATAVRMESSVLPYVYSTSPSKSFIAWRLTVFLLPKEKSSSVDKTALCETNRNSEHRSHKPRMAESSPNIRLTNDETTRYWDVTRRKERSQSNSSKELSTTRSRATQTYWRSRTIN